MNAALIHVGCLIVMMQAAGIHAVESGDTAWTWFYKKSFTSQELKDAQSSHCVILEKEGLAPFTQLVLSWNADRPEQGHYSFWVQSRDHATKRWSAWHRMMEWGVDVQRSYLSVKNGSPSYIHVRLETGDDRYSDGFRIKILSHAGASLSALHHVFISLSDFTKFKAESGDYDDLESLVLKNVPQKAQLSLDHPRSNGLCGPTSCSMVLSYLMGQDIDPVDFAKQAYDSGLNVYGSWPFNMAHAFERSQGTFSFAMIRLHSFRSLYERLQHGMPVIVSVRGYLKGAPKVYDSGHFIVVIGFDAKRQQVICHDPAFERNVDTLKRYSLKSFLAAWERSHRLAYVAEPLVLCEDHT